jgi:hypothetical protein
MTTRTRICTVTYSRNVLQSHRDLHEKGNNYWFPYVELD